MRFTNTRGILVLTIFGYAGRCLAITNAQFNASLRDYSAPEDNVNSTEIRTLQKELSERYAQAPVSNVVRLKEVSDSVLSGSSHGRGLLPHNHHGYSLADYEESPHYVYEYHYPDDHGHPDYHDHHPDHHGHPVIYHNDHKHGHGYHYKHYDHHALAAKTVLWPIAGIALLGAAAALVSNPVLLQLGVVSGRRRRDVETTERPDNDHFLLSNLHYNKNDDSTTRPRRNNKSNDVKRNVFNKNTGKRNHRLLFGNVNSNIKAIQTINANTAENDNRYMDKHYIPIPLKIKETGD